ncbi:hypothetical protein [Robiginitalea sp. SC105]|uniref:hypothetical protein n=1 Tax=Robiginitalea sp. SC105 TaxID=2762332 RepID=UPI001639E64B|nr:hypothetical protein [Robiginitalea sp. SC105]MBC2838606.1 hypothetical protein [Robiginitalea sp. SC105]
MKKSRKPKRNNAFTKNYFFVLSLTILALGLIAFSDNYLFDIHQESNSDPFKVIHGLIMFSWYTILVIQTNHIRKLNVKAHKRLGLLGFGIAVLVVVSIAYLNYMDVSYAELPFFGKANRIFFPVFILLLALGYAQRNKPELHKHAIFVGVLLMMEPLLSRVGMNTGTDAAVVAPIIWLILWISLFVYDIIRLRSLHFLTCSGLIFWFAVYAMVSLKTVVKKGLESISHGPVLFANFQSSKKRFSTGTSCVPGRNAPF